MRSIAGAVGWLLVAFAAAGGCNDPSQETLDDPAGKPVQRRSALATMAPVLVRDITPSPSPVVDSWGSDPSKFVQVGNKLFFVAQDSAHGYELWVIDGTAAARLVRDFAPGDTSSYPSMLTAFKGLLYFTISSELWRSDGTPEGTQPFYPETSTALGVSELKVIGETMYMSAGLYNERELYKTDGTPQNTVQVKEIRAGFGISADISWMTDMGGTLFFLANDGYTGQELWKSDGTSEGTQLVKDITPGSTGTTFDASRAMRVVNNTLYLSVQNSPALWKTDGTTAGTVLMKSFAASGHPQEMTQVGNTVFFSANDGVSGVELWKSSGTAASTVVVKDMQAGSGSSYPMSLIEAGGWLYFFSGINAAGDLYKSDGTDAGTQWVATSRYIYWERNITRAGTGVYFFERGSTSDKYALSRYDTVSGTKTVLHTFTPTSWNGFSSPTAFGLWDNTLIFAANDTGVGLESWKTDGTPEGTVPLANISIPTHGSRPAGLVSLENKLFFTVFTGTGRDLWSSTGTEPGTTVVKQGFGGIFYLSPQGGTVYFSGHTSTAGNEPWLSDGTEAGTRLIKDINPGTANSSPWSFVLLNGKLLFFATTPANGSELWVSDGTDAGTMLLKDINPGTASSSGRVLGVVDGVAYLSADDGAHGYELWRTDGTAAGTVLVKDLVVGTGSSYPSELRGLNGSVVFAAYNSASQSLLWRMNPSGNVQQVTISSSGVISTGPTGLTLYNGALYFFTSSRNDKLWKYDGTTLSATAVVLNRFVNPTSLVSGGNGLYFIAGEQQHGTELWFSDGTAAGTRIARDVYPGHLSGAVGGSLLAVPSQGVVVFRATDGVHGVEPWVSDGTEAGTWMEGDLAPGPATSNPTDFTLSGNSVFFSADDGTHGVELWRFSLGAADTTPPTVVCPTAVTSEAQSSAGAPVSWPPATTSDDVTASPTVMYSHASGSVFPLGTTTVTATATDEANNSATCSFTVTVRDTTAPSLTCPANLQVEASGAQGATASFSATVSDSVTTSPGVTYSHASSSVFPLGTTTVTATATDATNNTATCSFTVTIQDTTAPSLTCPAAVIAEATGSAGAPVTYGAAASSDSVSSTTLTYSHASGSLFPLGTTTVTATATDEANNTATCSFTVSVRDTTAPSLTCPAAVIAEATGSAGASVTYGAAASSDSVSSTTLIYSHASGSMFPLGTTTVTATATDAANNSATCSFTVTIRDTTAPFLTCPADVIAEATGSAGAPATYGAAASSDSVSAATLTYSHASGSMFPLGTTTVTVTTQDEANNSATCSFAVTVRDTAPPSLTCPADITAEAQDSIGATVSFPPPSVSDAVTSSTEVTYSHASGITFALGETQVLVVARDEADNTSSCSFRITVKDSQAPELACPSPMTVEATGPEGAQVTLASATVKDSVTTSPQVTYRPNSGDTFALGESVVTVTAKDAADNIATCSFSVTVRDTLPPAIACPADIEVEARDASGSPVEYPASTVNDTVTANPSVAYSQTSGSVFPVGTTTVTATATDAAGLTSSCSFRVSVKPLDTRPPPQSVEGEAGCGCGTTSNSQAALWGALALIAWPALRRTLSRRT
ncbi:ELWxxDGT repeat protein [Hyalangium versicolor]|uniref:ELWxxDGT repeat protein n=1 Tax=Hyalangium versicolor TaxID=2861190 RepID=UPI001CCB5E0F|nr:ELWxxDGT repeat protein [Hyalangium versicolor]